VAHLVGDVVSHLVMDMVAQLDADMVAQLVEDVVAQLVRMWLSWKSCVGSVGRCVVSQLVGCGSSVG
jgi:hypothetical protein